MIKTFLERKLGTSISDNGLIVPLDSLGPHLQRYSFPAIFTSEVNGEVILTKGGSLTKVKANNRYFAVTAYHVISANGYELTQLCLPQTKEHRFVTSHAARFPVSQAAQDRFDYVSFEFTEAVVAGLLDRSAWFDVSYDLARHHDIDSVLVGCVGYPSHRNFIRYDEKEYPVAPNLVWGEQTKNMLADRRSFQPVNPISYDPSGMSGAPVFGLELREFELHLSLAGVLTNASPAAFNYLPISSIELT